MATDLNLDLESSQNEILLNPRWPRSIYDSLYATAQSAQEKLQLQGHVWIATSGSTAADATSTKLVALSKKALKASALSVNAHLQSDSSDVWSQVLPTYHVGGLGIEVRALLSEAKAVSGLRESSWDALHFYEILKNQKVTLAALVPTQIFDLVRTHQLIAPPSLRAVVIGGGAFSQDLYFKARELGWPVLPSYGMTETASQIATASLSSLSQMAYPPIELLSHAKARSSEDGFLEVWAESSLSYYARKQNSQVEIWDPKVLEWFKTEDRGWVQGRSLIVEGRRQDYIKIGGEATNIAQLRSLLDTILAEKNPNWVQKLALLDMPSGRLGVEIHLATTLTEDEAKTVQELFSEKVRPFEKIRQIHYLREIPRSDLGKIKWQELRSQCEARR